MIKYFLMDNPCDFLSAHWPVMQQAELFLPRPNPTAGNPTWEAAEFRVLIVRLSPYRDVDRSTPHLFLAQAARRAVPAAYVDFAFFPPQHDRKRLEAAGVPLLTGIFSWCALEVFDVVLISNAYTLELLNLPYLLQRSGIPLYASERDGRWPPLILGGSNALAAQALLTPEGDALVDALFFGEGEREVEALLRVLAEDAGLPKRERLRRAAASVAGLWLAGESGQRVRKAICANPGVDDLLLDYPLLNGDEAGVGRLQINYGCPAFCSFCFEGYDRKPYRELPRAAVLEAARTLKSRHGVETLELYSFNFNTHADILALLLDLHRLFRRVSFKSQRVDMLYTLEGAAPAAQPWGARDLQLWPVDSDALHAAAPRCVAPGGGRLAAACRAGQVRVRDQRLRVPPGNALGRVRRLAGVGAGWLLAARGAGRVGGAGSLLRSGAHARLLGGAAGLARDGGSLDVRFPRGKRPGLSLPAGIRGDRVGGGLPLAAISAGAGRRG